MARRHAESAIQRELIKWLDKYYPFIEYKYNKNEGQKAAATAAIDKMMGLKAGWSDLDLYHTKKGTAYVLHLELKTTTGSLNPAQAKWFDSLPPAHNRKAIVAYGLIDAQTKIENWLASLV